MENKKMKILEKFTLILYSNIVLILSVLLCTMIFGWVNPIDVGNVIGKWLSGETSSKIILGVSAVFIILSLRCILIDKTSKEQIKDRQGVLLQNENGKLMISKDTLESLVTSVANDYKDAKEITTRVELDRDNNVNVFANLIVTNDAVIKDLTVKLQKEMKDRIKKATDLDVKEVNIKIKNSIDEKPEGNVSAQ